MLAGLQIFVPLHWGRFGLWLVAILAGGGGAGRGRGGAGGGGARGPRGLPARLHGHPAGRLPLPDPLRRGRRRLYDAIRLVTALFPFKPALQAMTAALDPAGAGIGAPLLHLAILIAAYGLLARLALRRFAAV